MVARGMFMVARGCEWLPGRCVVVGGMHGCWEVCMIAGRNAWLQGVCMVAGACVVVGACVVAAGGGMHGCRGASMVKGTCMAKGGMCGEGGHAWQRGGHVWDMTRYRDLINERVVRILLKCILVSLLCLKFFDR